jgi:hypothetical protein
LNAVLDSQPQISFKTSISGLPIGEYDECLGIQSPQQEDKPIFKGQYCALEVPELTPHKSEYKFGEPIDNSILEQVRDHFNSSNLRSLINIFIYLDSEAKYQFKPQFFEDFLQINDRTKPNQINVPTGFCLPTTCNPKDIEYAINKCKNKSLFKLMNQKI